MQIKTGAAAKLSPLSVEATDIRWPNGTSGHGWFSWSAATATSMA
jgi:hypothetical protein